MLLTNLLSFWLLIGNLRTYTPANRCSTPCGGFCAYQHRNKDNLPVCLLYSKIKSKLPGRKISSGTLQALFWIVVVNPTRSIHFITHLFYNVPHAVEDAWAVSLSSFLPIHTYIKTPVTFAGSCFLFWLLLLSNFLRYSVIMLPRWLYRQAKQAYNHAALRKHNNFF